MIYIQKVTANIEAASELQRREQKIQEYRKEIISRHLCTFHSPPEGKQVVCYKDALGTCYSLTDQDLLYWATLGVSLNSPKSRSSLLDTNVVVWYYLA